VPYSSGLLDYLISYFAENGMPRCWRFRSCSWC